MAEGKAGGAERKRLADNNEHRVFWKKWGPYLSERQWGTVREDYSENGTAWEDFPHDHARSRAYRWGEDGIAGISDINQDLCFALALWNGQDEILKERLFGLTGNEGNHGEDVKELYYYLDNTPTHSYMKYLYKYPHERFPYEELRAENRRRSKTEPEYELLDTGLFDHNAYFDVFVEYAKREFDDMFIKIAVFNRGAEAAEITVLPTLWFRNTWSFGKIKKKPSIREIPAGGNVRALRAEHETLGRTFLFGQSADDVLFTENETNYERLFGVNNPSPRTKDAFHSIIVHGQPPNPPDSKEGTKAAFVYRLTVPAGGDRTIWLRFAAQNSEDDPFHDTEAVLKARLSEADAFYAPFVPPGAGPDAALVQRQAFAGLLWSKQYYNYEIETWLRGDPGQPRPPESRKRGRNADWPYLFNRDVISMPDKWEYPWYATWDLAFHCVSLALIDPHDAKRQLILFLREWYMHPNGQLPAYEWALGDVNPPVHAWACLRVYEIEREMTGRGDVAFLKRTFHKLLLNFTWWVNRKDLEGRNIFQGGFLGLDNIGIFDRSRPLPTGGHLEQADATGWMAMYALNMMVIALEIAATDPAYEDVASKFFEHFAHIAEAFNSWGGEDRVRLWNEEDGFFYDAVHSDDGRSIELKIRSLVGIIPLYAVAVMDSSILTKFPGFAKRLRWFRENRKALDKSLVVEEISGVETILFSLLKRDHLARILKRVLDEKEFLAPGGIRSLSKEHRDRPFSLSLPGGRFSIPYEPGESTSSLFGGNSNWRGPIWMPTNYLLIESLKLFGHYFGDSFQVECPTGSGQTAELGEVARRLAHRLCSIFFEDDKGRRPIHGRETRYADDPYFRNLVLFYEHFHGDTCRGIGASHQTGWTALIANLIKETG
ncbi:MAG: glucosidase [Acidobacteriota bacterium]|nr:glucosidase [Acidobacteriota bacterium]